MAKTVQGKYPRRKGLYQSSGAPIKGQKDISTPATSAKGKGWEWYAEEAQDLIEEYHFLRKDQIELDKIANLDWGLPDALKKVGKRAVQEQIRERPPEPNQAQRSENKLERPLR